MTFILDRRVFRRHAKRVPSQRMQNVITLHALEPGDGVADGVVAHMAHMNSARGIGKHFEQIKLFFGRVGFDLVRGVLFPDFLPLLFYQLKII